MWGRYEECIVKFGQVLELLCRPKVSIEDDTLLENLLDVTETAIKKFTGHEDQSCKRRYIHHIQDFLQNMTDPKLYVCSINFAFSIRLLGVCILHNSFDDLIGQQLIVDLISKARTAREWCHPSVRYATFLALKDIASSQHSQILTTDIIDLTFNSLQDDSIFVASAAASLLSSVLLTPLPATQQVVLKLTAGLKGSDELCLHSLKVLQQAVTSDKFSCGIRTVSAFQDVLIDLLLHHKYSIQTIAVNVLCGLLVSDNIKPVPDSVDRAIKNLLKNRKVLGAIKLTAAKLRSVRNCSSKTDLEVITSPLLVLTGKSSSCLDTECLQEVQVGMTTVSQAWKMLAQSCRSMEQLTDTDATFYNLCLQCLEVVSGVEIVSSPCPAVTSKLVGHVQAQLALMRCMQTIREKNESFIPNAAATGRTYGCLLKVLKNSSTDVRVVSAVYTSLLSLMNSPDDPCTQSSLDQLGPVLQLKLCDTRWEVRDCTIEFLNSFIKKLNDSPHLQWLTTHNLHSLILDSISDGESYVRASALTTLGTMAGCPAVLSEGLAKKQLTMDQLISSVLQILCQDSEAFARRAAVQLVCTLYQQDLLVTESTLKQVYDTLLNTMRDFDWEVKLGSLEFWDSVAAKIIKNCQCIESDIPSYAQGLVPVSKKIKTDKKDKLFKALHDARYTEALLLGLGDYDCKVKQKAARMLIDVKQHCDSQNRTTSNTTFDEHQGFHCFLISHETFIDMLCSEKFDAILNEAVGDEDEASKMMSLLDDVLASSEHMQSDNEEIPVDCY